MEDPNMKLSIGIATAALLATGFVTATPKPASAVIYCTYVARAAVRHNAGGNMHGGVNRVGARR